MNEENNELSLCQYCQCMTKTIKGLCGKCKENKSEFIKKTIAKYRRESGGLEKDCKFIENALSYLKSKLIEEIESIPVSFPNFESNDYDLGRKDFKEDVLSKLKKL